MEFLSHGRLSSVGRWGSLAMVGSPAVGRWDSLALVGGPLLVGGTH